ncbi:MAG: response regulator transcription factor [Alphaproteobacteria bacterium]|nr:response regulator transcription factor [Alphaproteobacteria bacterium]
MIRIRAAIVDDVELARERVRIYLRDEDDIDIVGEAANAAEALKMIARERPDLLFLDVALPDLDGFEIARRIEAAQRPIIIYLTAHDEKAIHAFEVNALDYLLKPFDRERFAQALNRARAQIALRSGHELRPAIGFQQRLGVKDGERTTLVAVADIDYIDVAGHYLCIHVGKEVHLLRGSLADLMQRLDPQAFVRIHRSALVQFDRIKTIVARRNGDADLVLRDGRKLLLSRTFRDDLRAKLDMLEG